MNRLPVLLSALFLTSALASPAFARVSSDTPSCGGGEKKDESKKGSTFVPSCGGDSDKKETKKEPKS